MAVARTDCECSAQQLASVLVPPQNHPHSKLLGFRHKAWSGRAPISKKKKKKKKKRKSDFIGSLEHHKINLENIAAAIRSK